jgi:hypothetical protein
MLDPLTLRFEDPGLEREFRVAQFSPSFLPYVVCLAQVGVCHVCMSLYDAKYNLTGAIYLPVILTMIVGRVWLSYAEDQARH